MYIIIILNRIIIWSIRHYDEVNVHLHLTLTSPGVSPNRSYFCIISVIDGGSFSRIIHFWRLSLRDSIIEKIFSRFVLSVGFKRFTCRIFAISSSSVIVAGGLDSLDRLFDCFTVRLA